MPAKRGGTNLTARRGRADIARKLRREYETEDTSIVALAKRHGLSRSTTQRLLWESNAAMRTPTSRPPALRPVTPEDIERLVDEWLTDRT